MEEKTYKVAGYVAILAVVAFILEVIVTLTSQVAAYSDLISPHLVALTLLVHIALASYATICLRTFLNERFEFHGTDTLIPLLVAAGIVFGLAMIGSGYLLDSDITLIIRICLGGVLGLISILFGYRLLAVESDIGGFKKPFAYCHMLAPLCFMSMVLAPLGLLLLIVAGVLLALIFFTDETAELKFV